MAQTFTPPVFSTLPLTEMNSKRGQKAYRMFCNMPDNVNNTSPINGWMAAKLIMDGKLAMAEKAIYRIDLGNNKKSRAQACEGIELAVLFLEQKIQSNRGLEAGIFRLKEGKDENQVRNLEKVLISLDSHRTRIYAIQKSLLLVLDHMQNFFKYNARSELVVQRIKELLYT